MFKYKIFKNKLCKTALSVALIPASVCGANSPELSSEIQRFLKDYPVNQVQMLRHRMTFLIAIQGTKLQQRQDYIQCVDARIKPEIFEYTSQSLAQKNFENLSNLKEINGFLESSAGEKYRQQFVSTMAEGLRQAQTGKKIGEPPTVATYTPEEMVVIQTFSQRSAYLDFNRFSINLLEQMKTEDTLDKKLNDIRIQCDLQTSRPVSNAPAKQL
jgi:hypothetical protein